MTIADGMLILATIAGPILAVQAQKWIERVRERRAAQQRVFYTLMATRATRVSPDHVQALNMIDLLFSPTRWRRQSNGDKQVIKAWREYADHLNINTKDASEAVRTAWNIKCYDLFIELLSALATALGYAFDKPQLRKGIYYPEAHDEAERKRLALEDAFIDVLKGTAPLSMNVKEFPGTQEAYNLQRKVNESIVGAFDTDGAIKVKTVQ
jgi:hypothetical protein